jgi:hypothetical protein
MEIEATVKNQSVHVWYLTKGVALAKDNLAIVLGSVVKVAMMWFLVKKCFQSYEAHFRGTTHMIRSLSLLLKLEEHPQINSGLLCPQNHPYGDLCIQWIEF